QGNPGLEWRHCSAGSPGSHFRFASALLLGWRLWKSVSRRGHGGAQGAQRVPVGERGRWEAACRVGATRGGTAMRRAGSRACGGAPGCGAGLVAGELELVEACVEAALAEELVVGTGLAELAVVHDEDAVGVLDGGEAVR